MLAGWDEFAPSMMAEIQKRSFTYRNTKTRVEKATPRQRSRLYRRAYLPLQARKDIESEMYWLGIDIGTGGSRALLVDERGGVEGVLHGCSMKTCAWSGRSGRSSGPENWWDAAQDAIRGVLAEGRRHRKHGRTRNRPFRPDAWADAARCGRQGHPSRAHLVRSTQPGASRLHQ